MFRTESLNQFLLCSTHSEHSSTKEAAQLESQPILRPDDVKIYLVDPRDEKPCLRELSDIYKEQVKHIIILSGPENFKKVQAKKTREIKNQFHEFFFTKIHFLQFQKWSKINF